MPIPTDPLAPKRPTLAQNLGARLGRAYDTTSTVTTAQAAGARDAAFGGLSKVDQAVGASQDAIRQTAGEFGASFRASAPATPPSPIQRPQLLGARAAGAGQVMRPTFGNVQGSADTRPAARPVNPIVPALGNGVPSPQTYTTAAGHAAVVPADLTRSVVNGVPTYTNAQPAEAAEATAPAAPVAAMPMLQMPAAPARTEIPMPRAPTADPYNTRLASEARNKLLSDIDSQQFQLRGKQTRSARGAMSDLAQVQANLVNTAGAQAIDVAGGDREAQLRQNLTGYEQQSAAQRTGMEQEGALQRTGLEQGGANYRSGLEIARPQYVTDADGNYLAVIGTGAQPVAGADGAAVRLPRTKDTAAGQITPAIALESLDKQYQTQSMLATDPGVSPENKAAAVQRMIEIDAQRSSLLRTPLPPSIGEIRNGYRFKGGDPADSNNWEAAGNGTVRRPTK